MKIRIIHWIQPLYVWYKGSMNQGCQTEGKDSNQTHWTSLENVREAKILEF